MGTSVTPPPDYEEIANRLNAGTIVVFFGAGASIACGLPSVRSLTERLVLKAEFPDDRGREDLALVASYLVQKRDSLTLRDELRKALCIPAEPGRLHRFFADPKFEALQLFVTTNYDDLIEKALEPRAPWIVVDRGSPNTVWCRSTTTVWKEVESKDLRRTLGDWTRPVVLKLHGSLDRANRSHDSFLITEEDYVDFLGRSESARIPSMLAAAMMERSFLFLGYGLKDWNIRVLLRKLAQARGPREKIRSWAIVRNPGVAERELWGAQHVEIHDIDLDDFVTGLEPYV